MSKKKKEKHPQERLAEILATYIRTNRRLERLLSSRSKIDADAREAFVNIVRTQFNSHARVLVTEPEAQSAAPVKEDFSKLLGFATQNLKEKKAYQAKKAAAEKEAASKKKGKGGKK